MRRFYIDVSETTVPHAGQIVRLDEEQSKHLRTVLRLEPGEALELTDGRGRLFTGTLVGGGRRDCEVAITGVAAADEEVAAPLLHLACAVVKGKRFEYALEKAVELGVHAITPLRAERGVVDPRDGKLDRWRGLLLSALKQSGRCHLPRMRPLAEPAAVLDAAPGEALFGAAPADLVGEAPRGPTAAAAQAARRRLEGHAPPPEIVVLIGPEGGWSARELQLFAARDAVPLLLGPHVLRTETAAVLAGAAMAQIRLWNH
jgi:16S rRNA (uracil1498-N3)-methyltransferase